MAMFSGGGTGTPRIAACWLLMGGMARLAGSKDRRRRPSGPGRTLPVPPPPAAL